MAGWSLPGRAHVPSGRANVKPALRLADDRGRPPRVSDVRLADLGVHAPHGRYAPREADRALATLLTGDAPLVVVHGKRLTGTTRTVAEAVRTHLPDHTLLAFHPDPRVPLAALVAAAKRHAADGAVLWIDAAGTTALRQLGDIEVPDGVRVLVTAHSGLLAGARLPDPLVGAAVQVGSLTATDLDALRAVDVDVPAEPKPTRLGRLVVPLEPLRRALDGDAGLDRQALLRVFADWQRLDPPVPLTTEALAALYVDYRRELGPVGVPTLSRALEWAVDRGLVTAVGSRGFYYGSGLLSAVADQQRTPVSGRFWRYAARTFPADLRREVGLAAFDRGDYPHARDLLDDVADVPPRVMYGIAYRAHRSRSVAIARRWYEKAIAAGSVPARVDLGVLEAAEGRASVARTWFRAAIDGGDPGEASRAMHGLGVLEREHGNLDEARRWFTGAAASDDPVQAASAMVDLGALAEDLGDVDEARSWYERARAHSGRPISVLRPV
ncbi:tetratricopeptide repeat protein [Cryptosporangium phraense]|uniref:Tetratricopeptide repeat protein n=1 Tax=Cryptosporangium phraense TaxID=2593070 RepID=A0A545AM46_9ACTN|nr:tetratricopeptide repeat protein [Cryptosporangium phraense]TQS42388.1 tetratricopeptide repeat protein [Cryptosporangium phraense]